QKNSQHKLSYLTKMSYLTIGRHLFRNQRLLLGGSNSNNTCLAVPIICRQMSGNELGRGAGKGGGSGGSIRDAGGSMGKAQAAKEEEYFRRLEREQLAEMQHSLKQEVEHHEKEIAHHLEAIKKHRASMNQLDQAARGDENKKH
ncbi:hypothetical protein BOX15_Mlig026008g4, partial [Macrostomum lignano]